MPPFYVTTSIAYVNGEPHVGFAMESVEADVLARWAKMQGRETFFCTGTDEHGEKIQKTADKLGVTPQEICDTNAERFKALGKTLNISNNAFIRTSDKETHWPSVQALWKKLEATGDIEKRSYTANYCYGCEVFLTEKELDENGECPIHLRKPEVISEENYFFLLSKYSEQIAHLIESNELQIVPEFRKNEILNMAREGFHDVSFSRPSKKLPWGIPVPNDDSQNMYVWCDALTNYISVLGYAESINNNHESESSTLVEKEKNLFQKFWNEGEVVHVIGKDILRFHAGIWIGMLLSAGEKLPDKIFVHGFLTSEGHKMSKSIGNVVDPFGEVEKYGADALRYFLLREVPVGQDADFSRKRFEEIYQAHLANGLGNLVSRVLNLCKKSNISPSQSLPKGEKKKNSLSPWERAGVREASKKNKEQTPQYLLQFARELRKNQSDTETLLWTILRARRFENLKFKRQIPLGNFIADFYCHEKKLVIEIDGSQHAEKEQSTQDKKKDEFLKSEGLTVLRFWNSEVLENLEGVLETIYTACFGEVSWNSPHPNPLPEGEGTLRILKKTKERLSEYMDKFSLHEAISEIFTVVDYCDKRINEEKPWELVQSDPEKNETFLHEMIECISWIGTHISPFLPETGEKIKAALASSLSVDNKGSIPMLFPRLEKLNLPEKTENTVSAQAPAMPTINFEINPKTGVHAEYIFLENIAVKKTPKGLQKLCKKIATQWIENGGKENTDWKNRVDAMDQVKTDLGYSAAGNMNAAESLANLVVKNGKLPNFSNIVDVYNIISLKHGLSAGGHDCSFLANTVKIDLVQGDETFEPMTGKEHMNLENHPLQKNEYAFFINEKEIGCRSDSGQCEKSKIVMGNKNILIYFQAPTGKEQWAKDAMDEFLELLKEYKISA